MTFRSLLTGAVVQFAIFQSAVLPAQALDRSDGAISSRLPLTARSCAVGQPCFPRAGESAARGSGDVVADLGSSNVDTVQDIIDDSDRLLYGAENIELEKLRGERMRATISRPDGGGIITTRDRHGEIVSRVKRLPDGREFVLIDNRSPRMIRGSRQPLHPLSAQSSAARSQHGSISAKPPMRRSALPCSRHRCSRLSALHVEAARRERPRLCPAHRSRHDHFPGRKG
jgi:hypothetical protein